MGELFVLADDMTGALDTAVHFAMQGVSTCVVMEDRLEELAKISETAAVVVVSLPTRHIPFDEAYHMVYDATRRAVQAGFTYFYKKTDSAMRGNIGAELTAMLDAVGTKRMDFFPALPSMGRSTRNGMQMLNDTPVHQSVFSTDPFEPITESYIPRIIARDSSLPCEVVAVGGQAAPGDEKRICIYDAETNEDLFNAAQGALVSGGLKAMAGCAGLAGILNKVIKLDCHGIWEKDAREKMLVVCGSLNPITSCQLAYARQKGFARLTLSREQRQEKENLTPALIERIMTLHRRHSPLILDISEDGWGESPDGESHREFLQNAPHMREKIADNVGLLVKNLWDSGMRATLMIVGGDTLLAILKRMGCRTVRPVREIKPGVVLSKCDCENGTVTVISKSGGFGDEKLLTEIWDEMAMKEMNAQ